MKKSFLLILSFVLILVIMLSGCVNRSKYFAGDPEGFGESELDKEKFSYFCDEYGNLDNIGDSRILELMVTDKLENNYPLTKVSSFPINIEEFSIWTVYDNFNEGDKINITLKYLDDDETIIIIPLQAVQDYGRIIFNLEKPDLGWLSGTYEVIVEGNGAVESLEFIITEEPIIEETIDW